MLNRICCLLALLLVSGAVQAAATLNETEQKDGWKLLFDGESTKGWRVLGGKDVPAGWDIDNGCIHHKPKGGGGDLTYDQAFSNFELVIEWKVAPGANSGIKYKVEEKAGAKSAFGPEYQVIDNEKHSDAKNVKRTAGALYDVYAPSENTAKPAGEFNETRILVDGTKIEHWLNGKKVVACELNSADWKDAIAKSKFAKSIGSYAQPAKGQIALQDHGDEVWYRNIKIRELK